jgi:hypothetical protein
MLALARQAEEVLRADASPARAFSARDAGGRLALFVIICGVSYGAVMGSFGGLNAERLWQMLFSAAKLPLLLLGTFALCLPSFFVLNTVAGLRSDFAAAVRGLLTAQAAMTLVLCSLAPLTVLWYCSNANYHAAILFNGVAFAIASVAGQMVLHRLYAPLVRRNPRHALLLRVWLAQYMFVGMQLAWILRPFVGQPNSPVEWLRAEAWGNAYVEIARHITSLLGR